MNSRIYQKPEAELLLFSKGISLLVNLSIDSNIEDFETDELEDF